MFHSGETSNLGDMSHILLRKLAAMLNCSFNQMEKFIASKFSRGISPNDWNNCETCVT